MRSRCKIDVARRLQGTKSPSRIKKNYTWLTNYTRVHVSNHSGLQRSNLVRIRDYPNSQPIRRVMTHAIEISNCWKPNHI